MATRHLYLARHGAADAFGTLTETGRQQAQLLGQRLAHLPMDVVWHSPLPRAVASAEQIAEHLPGVPVIEAPELVDHVPYVPHSGETPPSWVGFFDGYTQTEAAAGQQTAKTLVARFGGLQPRRPPRPRSTRTSCSSRTPTRSPGSYGTRSTRPDTAG